MTKETIFEILGKLCRNGIGRECLWEFRAQQPDAPRAERVAYGAPRGGNKGNGLHPLELW